MLACEPVVGGVLSFGKYNTVTTITVNLKGGKTAVKGGKIPPLPRPPTRKYPDVHVYMVPVLYCHCELHLQVLCIIVLVACLVKRRLSTQF